MKREYDVKREMLLVFRNIVVSLFKGKDVFRIRRQFLGKGISLVFRTCAKGLSRSDQRRRVHHASCTDVFQEYGDSPVVTCETGIFQIAEVEVEEKTGRFRHGFKEYDNEVVATWAC